MRLSEAHEVRGTHQTLQEIWVLGHPKVVFQHSEFFTAAVSPAVLGAAVAAVAPGLAHPLQLLEQLLRSSSPLVLGVLASSEAGHIGWRRWRHIPAFLIIARLIGIRLRRRRGNRSAAVRGGSENKFSRRAVAQVSQIGPGCMQFRPADRQSHRGVRPGRRCQRRARRRPALRSSCRCWLATWCKMAARLELSA